METKNNDALEDFNKKAREELNEGYKLIVNHIDSVNDYLKKSSVEFPNCDNVNFNDYFFGTTTYMAVDCTISNLKSNETSKGFKYTTEIEVTTIKKISELEKILNPNNSIKSEKTEDGLNTHLKEIGIIITEVRGDQPNVIYFNKVNSTGFECCELKSILNIYS